MNAGEILNSTYEIREQIGAGGGGTIYKAYHKRLQKDVVLKKIHQSSGRNEDEKEILKNLKHSYLPQVYDFLDAEDGVYTIIDYIPGQSFEKFTKENHKFPQKKVVKYALQLCEVVDYLHKQNPPIIHGDIKPANIMLTPEDNICLIDFNISGVLDGKSMATMGYTPGYASPEQAASFRTAAVSLEREKTENDNIVINRALNSGNQTQLLGSDEQTEFLEPDGQTDTQLLDTDAQTELLDIDEQAQLLDSKEQTQLLDSDDCTQLLDSDERTELLHSGERTEFLASEVQTELLQNSAAVSVQQFPTATQKQFSHSESRKFKEQYTDQVDVRSDVYSIGATLYHLLTGVKPSSDPDQIVKPSELDSSIGESISIIVMKALSKDPKQRFQTVESMLRAFQKIHKYDARYKRMVLQQELIFLATAMGVGIGIMLLFFGRQRLGVEKEEEYVQTIAMLSDAVADREDEQQIEEMYSAATQIKPERLEAYVQKALYYYQEREYEIAVEYIEQDILPREEFYGQDLMADVYYILGNCCFELEQYENAIIYYRTAIDMNGQRPDFYRDYVISLVRVGDALRAEEMLAEAEDKGLSSIDLLLVNGELKKAKGDYDGAETDLRQCIDETEDDYIRMRAYVICDMVYREQDAALRGTEGSSANTEYLVKSQNLLEEARTGVGLENRLLIYERLAQTYIDLQELTSDHSYGDAAVSVLQEVIHQGWGTYLTYNNIAILYQKMGRLADAESTLKQMLELDAENYIAYKRLAFLEVDKQNQKENADRKYEDFLQYYEKAKELSKDRVVKEQDVEMQLLDQLYQQIEEGGWLQ